MEEKNFLDKQGLQTYDTLIKNYINDSCESIPADAIRALFGTSSVAKIGEAKIGTAKVF